MQPLKSKPALEQAAPHCGRRGSGLSQYRKDRNRYVLMRTTRVVVTFAVCVFVGRAILQDALGGPQTIASWMFPCIGALLVTANADHFAEALWSQIRPLAKSEYLHKPEPRKLLEQEQIAFRRQRAAQLAD